MTVYAAVYKAYPPKGIARTPLAGAFVGLASGSPAYYDGGDDPSFFSSERQNGPVTWGVCRTPLRDSVTSGDVVVFFARTADDDASGISYLLKGFATVERKISQVDIWTDPANATFQGYLNLLIGPAKGGTNRYRHSEPADDHPDWLWRVCGPLRGSYANVMALARSGIFKNGITRLQGGKVMSCRANYVIFSERPADTAILAQPFRVALAPPLREAKIETWMHDQQSQVVKRMVIDASDAGRSGRRGLKTTNPMTAHPPLKLDLVTDAGKWRSDMKQALGV